MLFRSVRELKGLFGKASRTVSIAEMNRAIAERGAAAGFRAGARTGRRK